MRLQRTIRSAATSMLLLRLCTAVSGAADLAGARDQLHGPAVIELTPGMTQLLQVGKELNTILLSDPRVAEATVINSRSVSITGRGLGLANLLLLDASGVPTLTIRIQVVAAADVHDGPSPPPRRAVRVRSFGPDRHDDERIFLCGVGCAPTPPKGR